MHVYMLTMCDAGHRIKDGVLVENDFDEGGISRVLNHSGSDDDEGEEQRSRLT